MVPLVAMRVVERYFLVMRSGVDPNGKYVGGVRGDGGGGASGAVMVVVTEFFH